MSLEFEVTELHRRLANLVMLGKVIEADYSAAIPRLKVKLGELQTAWLPMLTQRAGNDVSWWPLEVDEQVVVLSPSGDPAQGVVLGAINQQSKPATASKASVHKTTYADGAVIEYDREVHQLKAVLPDGGKVQLVSEAGIAITGDVSVTGNITASGEISDHTRSMQEGRVIYNQHVHAGVVEGSSSTATPSQNQ
jgi:phage baseplate assembly protein V